MVFNCLYVAGKKCFNHFATDEAFPLIIEFLKEYILINRRREILKDPRDLDPKVSDLLVVAGLKCNSH